MRGMQNQKQKKKPTINFVSSLLPFPPNTN